ncbi:MAG: 5'-methylthioadenosine/adenosylhomocysteine nucleosidase [Firmicutes bacterium]|nr:5'-methylthioadenosine/adenosylhomocysteine nucleosidase [Bacillota bacterium]
MKKIGIIGAMDEELEMLLDKIEIKNKKEIAKMVFYEGKLLGKSVILVRCGIGKVNAALCTQILISEFKIEAVINTGVAGAVSKNLDIGDIVVSKDVIQHDFNATGFGYKLGEIPRLEEYIFKSNEKLIDIAKKISSEKLIDHKVSIGRILSGDIFVASSDMKDKLWKNFKGDCAEMEGAAIGHACFLNDIPFVILRSISDKADGKAHGNFNDFVHQAAINSANIVEKMVSLI